MSGKSWALFSFVHDDGENDIEAITGAGATEGEHRPRVGVIILYSSGHYRMAGSGSLTVRDVVMSVKTWLRKSFRVWYLTATRTPSC